MPAELCQRPLGARLASDAPGTYSAAMRGHVEGGAPEDLVSIPVRMRVLPIP